MQFGYSAAGSSDSTGNTTTPNLTYSWTFQRNSQPDGSGTWSNVGISTSASGTFTAPSAGRYRALLLVTEVAGCTAGTNSNEIDVSPMFASASKTLATAGTLSVTLSGNAPTGSALQWQRFDGTNWLNISGANSTSLVYSSFEADVAPVVPFNFTLGSDSYAGKQWVVRLRLHATRTFGGNVCTADSPAQTVKKVTGVDP
ncbi:MAG TPA: hypothetical protein VJT74_02450 [Pyrinomonadaceae bacterium]|nr:hypothetical protein [Pyrinomonadaceae bacterium]